MLDTEAREKFKEFCNWIRRAVERVAEIFKSFWERVLEHKDEIISVLFPSEPHLHHLTANQYMWQERRKKRKLTIGSDAQDEIAIG